MFKNYGALSIHVLMLHFTHRAFVNFSDKIWLYRFVPFGTIQWRVSASEATPHWSSRQLQTLPTRCVYRTPTVGNRLGGGWQDGSNYQTSGWDGDGTRLLKLWTYLYAILLFVLWNNVSIDELVVFLVFFNTFFEHLHGIDLQSFGRKYR